MPQREKKVLSGRFLEVEVFQISIKDRKQSRKKKGKASRIAQKNLNDKNAKKHLIRLINTNFTVNDFAVHLTYKKCPNSLEEVKKDTTNYLRRVKHYRKKHKLSSLKYIAVIEEPTGKRVHLHIIMSGGIGRDIVEKLWKKGYVNCDRLQEDEHGFEALARYISKDPKGKKRWLQSRNLKQPVIRVNDWRFSRRKVEKLSRTPEDRKVFENLYKGYAFTDCKVEVNKITSNISLYIKMRKLE